MSTQEPRTSAGRDYEHPEVCPECRSRIEAEAAALAIDRAIEAVKGLPGFWLAPETGWKLASMEPDPDGKWLSRAAMIDELKSLR